MPVSRWASGSGSPYSRGCCPSKSAPCRPHAETVEGVCADLTGLVGALHHAVRLVIEIGRNGDILGSGGGRRANLSSPNCPVLLSPKTASNGITVDAATINIDARQIKIGFRLIFQIEQATGHEMKLSGNTYNASFFNVQLYVVDSIIPKHMYAIDNSKKKVYYAP